MYIESTYWILNSFSLNMVAPDCLELVRFRPISLDDAQRFAPFVKSAVGHADTAAIFAEKLGFPVPQARVTVTLREGDRAIVGQYMGPRLPEGATTLPEGASIQWIEVFFVRGEVYGARGECQ